MVPAWLRGKEGLVLAFWNVDWSWGERAAKYQPVLGQGINVELLWGILIEAICGTMEAGTW